MAIRFYNQPSGRRFLLQQLGVLGSLMHAPKERPDRESRPKLNWAAVILAVLGLLAFFLILVLRGFVPW